MAEKKSFERNDYLESLLRLQAEKPHVFKTLSRAGRQRLGRCPAGISSLFGLGADPIRFKSHDERVSEEVARQKEKPFSVGLDESQIRHNAEVQVEINHLLRHVPEEYQDRARRMANSWFY